MQWRVSNKQAGMRLLQFLRESDLEAPSIKAIKRAIDHKQCAVNHHTETFSSRILQENDVITLEMIPPKQEKMVPPAILFQDAHLIVINKPAGLLSEPKSIQSCFPGFLEPVHRLDRETSGALILARTPSAKEQMTALFKERSVHKLYFAIVDGKVSGEEGTIDNFLGKKHGYQGQTVYGSVTPARGQRAVTFWKCLRRGKSASLVCCEPKTGRTHQLRVHLSEMGHPVLGDIQYGKKFICPLRPSRNLLHAYRLSFRHPVSGKVIKVTAPIPSDFKIALVDLEIS